MKRIPFRGARSNTNRALLRARRQIAEQKRQIAMLQEEFGSLLDLVPLVDLLDGADTETVKWLMGGSFLPHIAQLMVTTMLAFDAENACEWHLLNDARGEFILTIQRKAGKSPAELRSEALDAAKVATARLVALSEIVSGIRPAFDAYMDSTGSLEGLLDAIYRSLQAAEAPQAMAIADITAAAWNALRREDRRYADLALELLPRIMQQLLNERRAARTLLDRQEIAAGLRQAPHFGDLYRAYTQVRGSSDNPNQEEGSAQESNPAAQAGSGHD